MIIDNQEQDFGIAFYKDDIKGLYGFVRIMEPYWRLQSFRIVHIDTRLPQSESHDN